MGSPVRSDRAVHAAVHSVYPVFEPVGWCVQAVGYLAHQHVMERGYVCNLVEHLVVDEDRDLLCQLRRHRALQRLFDFGDRSLVLGAQGEKQILDHRQLSKVLAKAPAALLRARKPDAVLGCALSIRFRGQVGSAQRSDLDRAPRRHHYRQEIGVGLELDLGA